jgi:hypothetical protein
MRKRLEKKTHMKGRPYIKKESIIYWAKSMSREEFTERYPLRGNLFTKDEEDVFNSAIEAIDDVLMVPSPKLNLDAKTWGEL